MAGIINGCTNFMLTAMDKKKQTYEDALAEASRLGYAEADPTLDVDGFDARSKLKIQLRLAYGIDVKEEEASDDKRKLQKHLKNPSSKGEEGTLPDHVSSDSLVKEGEKAILLQSIIIHTPTLSRRNKKLLSSTEDERKYTCYPTEEPSMPNTSKMKSSECMLMMMAQK
jgi:hypothetical protein